MHARTSLLLTTLVALTATADLTAQLPLEPMWDSTGPFAERRRIHRNSLLSPPTWEARDRATSQALVRLFEDGNHTATVTVPAGQDIQDFQPADLNNDGLMDLVIMLRDPAAIVAGSIQIYLDVQADQVVDHTVSQLGQGFHSFVRGNLAVVQPTPGSADHILIGAPDYSRGNQTREGLVACLELTTGSPNVIWGWEGAYPNAQIGAVSGRDAVLGSGGIYLFTEQGHQGAQGDEGYMHVGDPINGTIWWGVEGQPGSKIGTKTAIRDLYAFACNADADHTGLLQTGNGAVLHINVWTLNGIIDFGLPGEGLGTDIAPYGPTHLAVASRHGFSLFPDGSGTPDYTWQPPNPGAVSIPGEALTVHSIPNLPDPAIIFQTEEHLGGGQINHFETALTTETSLRCDKYRHPMQQPYTFHLTVDEPNMASGVGILGLSFVDSFGSTPIPGINGVLLLEPPTIVLGLVFLDSSGLGIYSLPWPGANFATIRFLASGAVFAPPGPSPAAEFLPPVRIQLEN